MAKYDVISPDGFSIHFSDTYSSIKKAKEALRKWTEGYERQGYYSSMKYGRIPLNILGKCCEIVKITK